jgi:hypothetical protein
MREAYRLKIKEILGEMSCPKDFRCVDSGFQAVCRAEDVGSDCFLRCLEDDPQGCPFAAPCRGTVYCECPLRVFICKKLNM